jgi:outer membrane protein insertion porin family
VLAPPSVARAQPLKTWGSEPAEPTPPADPRRDPNAPPPPPPPTEPSRGSPPTREEPKPSEPSPGLVRGPGKVGLRYVLEGIEIRGNTTTLARVIHRFVPFRAGDTLDVDDKELVLTRFRLLGTGFFRDVQLSLRRGTKRGYVVLQVDVVERNTASRPMPSRMDGCGR